VGTSFYPASCVLCVSLLIQRGNELSQWPAAERPLMQGARPASPKLWTPRLGHGFPGVVDLFSLLVRLKQKRNGSQTKWFILAARRSRNYSYCVDLVFRATVYAGRRRNGWHVQRGRASNSEFQFYTQSGGQARSQTTYAGPSLARH
jgi:hypothetical protein